MQLYTYETHDIWTLNSIWKSTKKSDLIIYLDITNLF